MAGAATIPNKNDKKEMMKNTLFSILMVLKAELS
jgi:hypothetical protein